MRRFLPSFSALQAFDSAARHLSFTRAAEDLMLTQSGISRQINTLETQLGVRLFERTGSRLVLTDVGRTYSAEVRQSLDRLQEVSIDVVRGRTAHMSLMLGVPGTFAARWFMPRLSRFAAAFPGVPTEVVTLPQTQDPEPGDLDIAILRGVAVRREFRATPLFRERLAVVAAPALLDRLGPLGAVLDFERLPTLQNSARPSLWLSWLRAVGQRHDGVIQGIRLPENELLIRAALDGVGLAVVPIHYVTEELRTGRLVLPFGAAVLSGESFWVALPEAKAHRTDLLAVRDWLLNEANPEASTDGPTT
ncbi:LysR substrate-binding domain-containing protein [Pseudoruegeria sp. SK021]|uniref:LysR substrate-binding domain-containing protein n=1 Tax=Pseudoruegeria sp. SK021 TaxID=1933035 RepID=UPI000A21D741|nr:LysR substrate-binding domain-containing protein [Pseudoruegeria sp. SK021]OSP54904.1 hypothetical protein BV911_10575 [Pseudoruegeria sp. SK021]